MRHGYTRRGFLQAAGAGLLALPAFGQRPGPGERVTVGVIGTGSMGTGDMGDLLFTPGAQVVAVCDVDRLHAEQAQRLANEFYGGQEKDGAFRGVDRYGDFRELLARDDIDAVLIGTPDHWHALISIAAMASGKDVYCEKPLALTIEEGRAIARAAERYGRVFQHGTQLRSHRAVRRVIELVRNGAVGKVRRVEIGVIPGAYIPRAPEEPVPGHLDYDLWLGPAPYEPYTPARCHVQFRSFRDYSGGSVTDLGTHYVDVSQWACGTEHTGPVRIEGQGTLPVDALGDVFTFSHYTCTFEHGLVFDVSTEHRHGARFIGTEGWIYQPLGFPGPNTALTGKETEASDPRLLERHVGADGIHLSPGWRADLVDFGQSHKRNFIDAVRTRSESVAPAEVAHRSTSICHLGNIAMLLGRPVQWDPAAERFMNDDDANAMLSRPMRGPWRLT